MASILLYQAVLIDTPPSADTTDGPRGPGQVCVTVTGHADAIAATAAAAAPATPPLPVLPPPRPVAIQFARLGQDRVGGGSKRVSRFSPVPARCLFSHLLKTRNANFEW